MEIKQQLKQLQHLVMTPQLQQAIRLLQLNQLELRDEIGHELENNPVLADELTDPKATPTEGADAPLPGTNLAGEERVGLTEVNEAPTSFEERVHEKAVAEVDWEQFLENRSQQQALPSTRGGFEELPPIEQNLTRVETLVDHLRWQIQNSDFTEEERHFAELVLASLDDSGFLESRAGYRETIEDSRRLLREDPSLKAPLFNLGVVYDVLGRHDDARAALVRYLGTDASPEHRAFAEGLRRSIEAIVREIPLLQSTLQILRTLTEGGPRRDALLDALRSDGAKLRLEHVSEALRLLRGQTLTDEQERGLQVLERALEELASLETPRDTAAHQVDELCGRATDALRFDVLTHALAIARRIDARDLEAHEVTRARAHLAQIEHGRDDAQEDDAQDDPDAYVAALAERAGLELEDAVEVLKIMQQMDPVGTCCRDLRESLKVQAELYGYDDTEVAIIDRHLHNLEKRNWGAIARDLKCSVEEVLEAAKQIQKLESRPARNFTTTDEKSLAIMPDVYVEKDGDKWQVRDDDKGLQRLYINESLAKRLLKDPQAKDFIGEKLRNAQWLIRAIEQRRKTIIRVTECIVEKQGDFFKHGVAHLKPMILRDVAESVGMHESTISRVTTNKYVHTPQGLFELKYFFNSAIRRTEGVDDIASEAVKQAIKRLIDAEDKDNPLSDQAIVERLEREEGIQIARRTVAKYREVMGILASGKRKKMF